MPEEKTGRPEGCKIEHLEYLDDLRESGITNMYGARSYLVAECGLDEAGAGEILAYWMKTFGNEER